MFVVIFSEMLNLEFDNHSVAPQGIAIHSAAIVLLLFHFILGKLLDQCGIQNEKEVLPCMPDIYFNFVGGTKFLTVYYLVLK